MTLIVFQSTQAAILAERILLDKSVNVKVRPVPASVRAGCGICLLIDSEQVEYATSLLMHQIEGQFNFV